MGRRGRVIRAGHGSRTPVRRRNGGKDLADSPVQAGRPVGVTLGLMVGPIVISDDVSDGIWLWRVIDWG